jgi:Holliday junction resolvase RusA-like endonuclease
MSARTLTVTFPPPAPLLSMNDRMHWRPKAKLAATWLHTARIAAHPARVKARWTPVPVTITVTLPVADRRRRDPHNYYPTVKVIVDAIVRAGIVPDDNSAWVTTTEPILVVGARDVVVHITPRGDQ